MEDLRVVGPNQFEFTYDDKDWCLLIRPHATLNKGSGLVEVWLPVSIYRSPIEAGDPPKALCHVTPNGQLVTHAEGAFMDGGPVCAIYPEDFEELING